MKIYSWRNCLAALAGNSFGLVLGVFVMPDLLTPYARALGLAEFPFVSSLAGTAVSFGTLPVCMLLGTCAVVGSVNAVSIRQLVSE